MDEASNNPSVDRKSATKKQFCKYLSTGHAIKSYGTITAQEKNNPIHQLGKVN